MSVTFDCSEAPGTIRLDGDVNIGCAAALKTVLEEVLGRSNAMQNGPRISLAAANGIDVTAVQLLWAAEREARTSGAVLALEGPVPEVLRATLREAGFQRFPFAPEAHGDAHGDAGKESQGQR